ncbi:MAG: hypothetical protein JW959_09510 [Pirellulales bacterium]|nr:hypothetical protein [Pirellulales bacterium]
MTNRKTSSYAPTRRCFIKGMATFATAVASVAAARSTAAEDNEEDKPKSIAKKTIKHILLFTHPPAKFSQNRLAKPNATVENNWIKSVAEKGPDPANAMCLLRGSKQDKPLEEAAAKHFGDRCFINPFDGSSETRSIMLGDLNRTFHGRGNHGEWNPYEIWSANNARQWAEGLKKQLAERGYGYDPAALTMETFGNWSGCHHKYSNFMAVYLDMQRPALIHAETELCSLKNVPMPAHEFVALEAMPEHVWLAIFKREDGAPMAQFWDGLRPVWRPPHVACVKMNPAKVDLFTFSPNSFIPVDGNSKKLSDGFLADVGDGAHPAFTTVVGRGNDAGDFEELRTALMNATIETRQKKRHVYIAVET